MKVELISKLKEVEPNQWDRLNPLNHPFTSFDFLNSLEISGSVSPKTGWHPKHIIVKDTNNMIIGACPNFLKTHSYGEYIFDHAWANAFENAGGQYYPKLISAIPFTPATGPRILIEENHPDYNEIFELIINTFEAIVQKNNLSSAHINFITDDFNIKLNKDNWIQRKGIQFHWYNKNYKDFDDFLSTLKSSKRKAIKKERRSINQHNLTIQKITGDDLDVEMWNSFYEFYLTTVDKKWGGAYLNREFFHLINCKMKDKILLIIAKQNDKIIAGALNFIGQNTLYGRNWGAIVDIPFLHFELCYYQAIEYAINHKIGKVEAGAQGNHKIQRGYLASPIYSRHFIQNKSFSEAIRKFVQLEEKEIDRQIEFVNQHNTPYSSNELC